MSNWNLQREDGDWIVRDGHRKVISRSPDRQTAIEDATRHAEKRKRKIRIIDRTPRKQGNLFD